MYHDQGIDLMAADIELFGMDISLLNAMNRGKILAGLRAYSLCGSRHTHLLGRNSSILDN